MAIVEYTEITAIDFRNDIDNYRLCNDCKRINHVSRNECWFCRKQDLREFPESFADSINLMIEAMDNFGIPIGVKSITP